MTSKQYFKSLPKAHPVWDIEDDNEYNQRQLLEFAQEYHESQVSAKDFDELAGKAMQAIASSFNYVAIFQEDRHKIAKLSYDIAEAMMLERSKRIDRIEYK